MEIAGRRVLVVGMARSGVAAATLAVSKGAKVRCVDLRVHAPVVQGTEAAYGPHQRAHFLESDLIVVSPGVPAAQADLAAAAAAGVPLLGELAFAASFLDIPILAISGTNGKSTTTHLLGQILQQAGFKPFVGGNLGTPLSEAVGGDFDSAAVEVSSYQMELPGTFHPKAAAILNLSPDHLERHRSLENYAAHKGRMFAQMTAADAAIVPPDVPLLQPQAGPRRRYLGGQPGVEIAEDRLIFSDAGIVSLQNFPLPGLHNRQNLAAALLLAFELGIAPQRIDLSQLRGLEHRLEFVRDHQGVHWLNDSKATNVDATMVALSAMTRPTVVLLGGRGKAGAPYADLVPALRHARAILCFGEEGPVIATALQAAGLVPENCSDMTEAVARAARLAKAGDTVLLSPACASFDAFNNFEHRGAVFRNLVQDL